MAGRNDVATRMSAEEIITSSHNITCNLLRGNMFALTNDRTKLNNTAMIKILVASRGIWSTNPFLRNDDEYLVIS